MAMIRLYNRATGNWETVSAGNPGIVRSTTAPSDKDVIWADTSDNSSPSVAKAIFDAKGDLIVGTGSDAYARVAVGADGSRLEADSSQAGGVRWQPNARGIIVPNAASGTTVTQAGFPGGTWSEIYGTNLYKIGSYWEGATLVNHAGGAQYVQLDHAGYYVFELAFSGNIPSSAEVGYGIVTRAMRDAGIPPYRDAHNHEKPYVATADYKVRTFQRYCAAGEMVAPIMYFSGATGSVVHNNGPSSACHFSFARVAP